jgi:hypothetical protein
MNDATSPTTPPLQSQCAALFGNPSHPGWAHEHIEYVPVPWTLMMDTIHITNIKVNKVAAPSLRLILAEIWEDCGRDQKKIKAQGLDVFSGDWVVRQARGLKIMSMHAFGLAIDFNAPRNKLGDGEAKTLFKGSSLIVQIFEKHGWTWGGRWKGRRDAMHFQFAKVG